MTLTDIIFSLLTMCGGAALFLYGMNVMSGGLEKVAGDSMQRLIENLTSNIIKGVLVGAAVTALIQSSGATTVMVVGFVNAGMMTLRQASGIIMGANIGTTVTAQILSLSGISGDTWYIRLFKPSTLANFLLLAGIILIMFLGKKNKKRAYVGEIILGLGAIFIGMSIMTDSISAMKDLPVMQTIFTGISNPILGIIAGALITALLQSSSASVGLLQAFTVTGLVTWSNALPMIMGANIGTCAVTIISGAGANKEARRASILNLIFKVTGVVLCVVVMYGLDIFLHFDFWNTTLTTNGVANIHSVFNILSTIVLLPFCELFIKVSCFIIPDGEKDSKSKKKDQSNTILDERLVITFPAMAVKQAMNEVVTMAETALKGYDMTMRVIENNEIDLIDEVKAIEKDIDKLESNISQYVTKIVAQHLTTSEKHTATTILHVVTDLERVGDHVLNICYCIRDMHEAGSAISPEGLDELHTMGSAVRESLELAVEGLKYSDAGRAMRIQPCEAVVDELRDTLKDRHVERLVESNCSVRGGIAFLDIVNNMERISDHCSNVGISIEQLGNVDSNIDAHKYVKHLRQQNSDLFDALTSEYRSRFSLNAE